MLALNDIQQFARIKSVSIFALSTLSLLFAVGCEGKRNDKVSLPAETPNTPVTTSSQKESQTTPVAVSEASPSQPVTEQSASPSLESEKISEIPKIAADSGRIEQASGRLTGEVTAPRRSQLTFKQQGFMQEIKRKPGSVVKKGELLAFLEDKDFELRLELAKARRDQGKVGLVIAEKELNRERQLAKENASTATALDRVQAQYDQAKLSLKLAEIDLTTTERALDESRLVAPYDCIIADQLKDEAEWVRPGDPIFLVYDTQLPEIKLTAPERLVSKIKVGDSLDVFVPSAGYQGQAKVIRTVPVINQRTRTFEVVARPDQADQRIVPGSYAEALFH